MLWYLGAIANTFYRKLSVQRIDIPHDNIIVASITSPHTTPQETLSASVP
jgi:hypothetical protein